jgi:hypothetical protein
MKTISIVPVLLFFACTTFKGSPELQSLLANRSLDFSLFVNVSCHNVNTDEIIPSYSKQFLNDLNKAAVELLDSRGFYINQEIHPFIGGFKPISSDDDTLKQFKKYSSSECADSLYCGSLMQLQRRAYLAATSQNRNIGLPENVLASLKTHVSSIFLFVILDQISIVPDNVKIGERITTAVVSAVATGGKLLIFANQITTVRHLGILVNLDNGNILWRASSFEVPQEGVTIEYYYKVLNNSMFNTLPGKKSTHQEEIQPK